VSRESTLGLCLLIASLAAAFLARAWAKYWVADYVARLGAKKRREELKRRKDFERADYFAEPDE
jgi:membrane protein DedA with SNARE-associated domain